MRRKIFGMHLGFEEAVATLVGTIIGAGVLAIPYSMKKAGFLTGLLILVVLSIAVLFLFLFVGEIVLRTKGNHQLTGYAEKYLGKTGKALMLFAVIFAILKIFGTFTGFRFFYSQNFTVISRDPIYGDVVKCDNGKTVRYTKDPYSKCQKP